MSLSANEHGLKPIRFAADDWYYASETNHCASEEKYSGAKQNYFAPRVGKKGFIAPLLFLGGSHKEKF